MRRAWIGGALAAVAVVTTAVVLPPGPAGAAPGAAPTATPAAPAVDPTLTLPRPSGPYLTGTTLLHLRDARRTDPLDPAGGRRELVVQLWYPAAAAAGTPFAPYAPPGEAAGLQAFYPVPQGAFSTRTNSRLGAPALPGRHRVVLYSHGLCGARTDDTAVSEQLASLGHVVAAIGTTHESPAVEFPGGRVVGTADDAYCAAGGDPWSPENDAILNRLLDVRVADARFVLDQLRRIERRANPDVARRPLPRGLAGSLDTRRPGMFGHSFGGGTTAAVLAADRRFAAGVNLDGLFVGSVRRTGLSTPLLVLGSSYHDPAQDRSWADVLPRLRGWHRWFQLSDAGHYRFIDLGGSANRWGLKATLDAENWRLVFGDIDDRTSQEIVTRTVAAFFERFLRHRPAPLLDRPAEFHPELVDRTGDS